MVAISPQLEQYGQQVAEKHQLTFPVLADIDNRVATQFGLTFTLPEPLQGVYSGFGIDLTRFNGNQAWNLPLVARFIIDRTGIIRTAFVHADYTQRAEPTDILAVLQALHG